MKSRELSGYISLSVIIFAIISFLLQARTPTVNTLGNWTSGLFVVLSPVFAVIALYLYYYKRIEGDDFDI